MLGDPEQSAGHDGRPPPITVQEPTLRPNGPPGRVLIVEDDYMTLLALSTLFERNGWVVDVAGSVAMAMFSLDPAPDWLILDLCLPDGHGDEVLRRVRADGMKTRVVVASAHLTSASVDRLMPLRPDLLMPKPIDYRTLVRRCDGSAPLSADEFLAIAGGGPA